MVTRLLRGERQLKAEEVPVIARYLDEPVPENFSDAAAEGLLRSRRRESHPDHNGLLDGKHNQKHAMPIYASEEGGPDGMIMSYDPIAYVARPEPLAHVRDAFAVYMVNESMEPRYLHGELLLIDPSRPVHGGDDVLITKSLDGGGQLSAMVKVLSRIDNRRVVVKQYNPPAQSEIERSAVERIYLVIGRYGRRGA